MLRKLVFGFVAFLAVTLTGLATFMVVPASVQSQAAQGINWNVTEDGVLQAKDSLQAWGVTKMVAGLTALISWVSTFLLKVAGKFLAREAKGLSPTIAKVVETVVPETPEPVKEEVVETADVRLVLDGEESLSPAEKRVQVAARRRDLRETISILAEEVEMDGLSLEDHRKEVRQAEQEARRLWNISASVEKTLKGKELILEQALADVGKAKKDLVAANQDGTAADDAVEALKVEEKTMKTSLEAKEEDLFQLQSELAALEGHKPPSRETSKGLNSEELEKLLERLKKSGS